MKFNLIFGLLMAAALLSGCAVPIIGPLTLSHLSSIATATTMTTNGKGAGEVALDLATGKDCRMMEGVFRKDRVFCEQRGSAATNEDFKGVVALLLDKPPRTDGAKATMIALTPETEEYPTRIRTLKRVKPVIVARNCPGDANASCDPLPVNRGPGQTAMRL
ncbi:MAG: hypothetical protein ABL951_11705 [Alphaproteobacteria bacterium]